MDSMTTHVFCYVVDAAGKRTIIAVAENVAARLLQEEIWAQTVWPEGQLSLEEMLKNDEEMMRSSAD